MQYRLGVIFWVILTGILIIYTPPEVVEGLSARMHAQGN